MICREWSIRFNIVVRHTEEALYHISARAREFGAKVIDVRETDIIMEADGTKVSEVYILVCVAHRLVLETMKERMHFDEIEYEGRRTLI
jgi:acetolactate synthase small subunit